MRKLLLVVLPLAALFLVIGCGEASQSSASPSKTTTTAPAAQASAPAPQQYRRSTTQPLPAGWGYLHDKDLADGKATPSNQDG